MTIRELPGQLPLFAGLADSFQNSSDVNCIAESKGVIASTFDRGVGQEGGGAQPVAGGGPSPWPAGAIAAGAAVAQQPEFVAPDILSALKELSAISESGRAADLALRVLFNTLNISLKLRTGLDGIDLETGAVFRAKD